MCERKLKVSVRQICVGVFLVFLFALASERIYAAEEFTKVPLLVNVLKGAEVNANDIEKMVKEANKILKQAKVQLDFDKSKNIVTNVNEGNNDGNIAESEENDVDENGRKELDKKFGKGKGVKIYITNKIRGSDSTRGLAPHVKEKDGKLASKPVIYLKKTTAANKSKGNDLAHECGHVFTLGKDHWIDKTKGTKADNTWHHATDPNNLMYAYNPYLKDGTSFDRGSNLTDDQIKEIQKGAKRLGKTVVAKRAGNNKLQPFVLSDLPTIHGGFVDEMGETPNGYTDLGAGFLYAETPYSQLEISLLTEGFFPTDYSTNMMFSLYFDSDNNPLTGCVSYYPGIEAILDVLVYGRQANAQYYDPVGESSWPLPGARIDRISKVLDGNDLGHHPLVTDYVDGLYFEVPIDSLRFSSDTIPVFVTCDDFVDSFDEASFILELNPPGPQFQLPNTLLPHGHPLDYSGIGFTPLSDVVISIDNDPLCTVQADEFGHIGGTTHLNWSSPGDLNRDDYFFVTARDDTTGSFDFSIIELQQNPANLNGDHVVDFSDFSIFTHSWLSSDWPRDGFHLNGTCP